MTRVRCHWAALTSHELMLLALYRSIARDDQREIDGLLYRKASDTHASLRFRDEGHQPGVEHLEASILRPFLDASRDAAAAVKRIA